MKQAFFPTLVFGLLMTFSVPAQTSTENNEELPKKITPVLSLDFNSDDKRTAKKVVEICNELEKKYKDIVVLCSGYDGNDRNFVRISDLSDKQKVLVEIKPVRDLAKRIEKAVLDLAANEKEQSLVISSEGANLRF